MPIYLISYMGPFCCHTLSKAFEISEKTAPTSRGGLQSNDAKILWTMERSWYSHEPDSWKPDWSSQNELFSCRYSNTEFNKIFSRVFPRIDNKETGL